MYNVLIVDDEEPVLDSYEFMLNSFSEGEGKKSPFSLAGKARNGYEALRLIHETEPDIVFLDINIPGMDGLAVLEDVHKKNSRMICILSTAYERFDLARRAIPLGVFAYLVKPVSKKTFFSALENSLVKLRSMQPENSEYSDPRLALFRRDISAAMDEQRWAWYRETLALPSECGLVLLVELEHDMESWAGRIAEQISYKYHCTFDVMLSRSLFLISEDLKQDVVRQKIVKLLEDLLGNAAWHYGLGGCYRGPELYQSCLEAMAELSKKRRSIDTWAMVSNKIAVLRQKIGLLTPEETESLFAEIWEPLFTGDFYIAKLRMVSLFTLLMDDIYGCWSVSSHGNAGDVSLITPSAKLPPARLPPDAQPVLRGEGSLLDPAGIMELPDLGAWKRWAEYNFHNLALQASLERQGNYPLPLVKALAFVRDNYTRSIQLGDVAEAAQVNAAHLSRLFTEHLKTNFIAYLTTLRINEAERLLTEKHITVKEAAFAVGYQDPNYFSKLFKKIKGILPTEAGH